SAGRAGRSGGRHVDTARRPAGRARCARRRAHAHPRCLPPAVAMSAHPMKLAVGPILYLWERGAALDFYSALCDEPVDIVYLGEVVCGKRRVLQRGDWPMVARALEAAGKEVVYSTLALIEAESELATMARIVDGSDGRFEANDMAVVQYAAGRPFVAGPHLNIYNDATLQLMASLGARRWVAPVELPLATIAAL